MFFYSGKLAPDLIGDTFEFSATLLRGLEHGHDASLKAEPVAKRSKSAAKKE